MFDLFDPLTIIQFSNVHFLLKITKRDPQLVENRQLSIFDLEKIPEANKDISFHYVYSTPPRNIFFTKNLSQHGICLI